MQRDSYEIFLLETRQSLKDEETTLKNSGCIDFCQFKKLKQLQKAIQEEIISYRIGYRKNQEILNLMEG